MNHEPQKLFQITEDGLRTFDEFVACIGDHFSASYRGQNLLFPACRCGDPARVRWLIEHGVDPRHVDDSGNTPIHLACLHCTASHAEVVEILLAQQVDLDQVSTYGETPIRNSIRVGNYRQVLRLIAAGASATDAGLTSLHVAAINGDLAQIHFHLSDASLEANDFWGRTPWLTAMCANQLEAAMLLAELGADALTLGEHDAMPIHLCAESNAADCLQWILEQGSSVDSRNSHDETALHRAAECGSTDAAQTLLSAGADIKALNHVEEQPINCATNVEMLKLLNDHGADLNHVDGCGYWPLKLAAEHGNLVCARWLIDKGANVNQTSTGSTALHTAINFDHLPIAEALIAAGSDVNAQDVDGESPLFLSASRAGARLLLQAGADPTLRNIDSKTAAETSHIPQQIREMLKRL